MSPNRKAFSRAELIALIVVAVILLAILIPAISHAGSKADASQTSMVRCQDNLRKLGIGLRQYASDNAGALPVCPTLSNPNPDLTRALLPKYVNDFHLFLCPAQKSAAETSEPQVAAGNISYFYYNALAPGENPGLSRFVKTMMTWPRQLKLSDDPRSWLMSDAWYSGQQTAHDRYKKGVNYLTLDGAVNTVTESPRKSFH